MYIDLILTLAAAYLMLRLAPILPSKDGEPPGMLGMVFIVPTILISIYLNDARFAVMGGAVLLIGIADDLLNLKAWTKLILQIVAAGMYGYLFPGTPVFHLFILIFIFNALNLSDGIDGLLLSVSTISFLAIFFFVRRIDLLFLILSMLLILPLNLPQAKIFLGDTGSLFLGFALFHYAKELSGTGGPFTLMGILCIVAFYPVFDTGFAFLRRILKGSNPMIGDRDHIHHHLREIHGPVKALVFLTVLNIINNVIFITLFSYGSLKLIFISSIIIVIVEGSIFIYAWKSKRL